jgi:hypothetical protein
MRRWSEAKENLAPAYQERGEAILRRTAIGMGQLDELLELFELAGLMMKPAAR